MSSCAICFEEIIESEGNNYTTTCNHSFHKECLNIWCRSNNSCPMCRKKNVMFSTSDLNICVPGSPDMFRESPLFNNTPSTAPTSVNSNYSIQEEIIQSYNNIDNSYNHYINNINNSYNNYNYNTNTNINISDRFMNHVRIHRSRAS